MGICQSYPDVLISSLTDYFCPSGRKVLRHEKLPDLLGLQYSGSCIFGSSGWQLPGKSTQDL
jgi:hypothetical protein